ncbi:unnamed protein product [Calypogeia fissa]
MSTMNVFVGNLQLPPFPAGQPASEVYKTLKDAYGGGILVGPNGVGILNNSNLVPAGNYTYVPAAAVVPRVGAAPYATARVGPYATFTYATAPGIPPMPPQVTGVPPIPTGIASQTTAGAVAPIPPAPIPTLERLAHPPHAAAGMGVSNDIAGLGGGGVAMHATGAAVLDRVPAYGTGGVTPNAASARISPISNNRMASTNPKVAARASESQVPHQNIEASPQQAYRGVVQEQKPENSSPISNPTTGGSGGPSRTTVPARGKLPDWSPQELKKLILAKKQEWEHATSGTPLQKKMASGKEKWKIIAENLVNEGMKNPVRDHSSCKKKWEKVTGEFKKVYDYERMVCNAEESYYAMSASERRRKNLPSNFSEEVYEMIVDWLPSRHEVDPSSLHVIDSSTRGLDDEAPASDSTPGSGSTATEFHPTR